VSELPRRKSGEFRALLELPCRALIGAGLVFTSRPSQKPLEAIGARTRRVRLRSTRNRYVLEQTLAGDVVDLEPNPVGILEQNGVIAGRPGAVFGRMHDGRTELDDERVHCVDVGAFPRTEANVM